MVTILKYSAVLMFFARAYEHIRWIGPFRDIFYHAEGLGGWIATTLDVPVVSLYGNEKYEELVLLFSDIVGFIYLLGGIAVLLYHRFPFSKWMIYVASGCLLFTYFGFLYGKNLVQFGMFMEHAAQFSIPFLFILANNNNWKKVTIYGSIAIALTFLCHGLYAMGYYPQPGNYADMMIVGLSISEDSARDMLVVIGYLDFIFAAICIISVFADDLLAHKWFRNVLLVNLVYGIVWGTLTSLARIYTSFDADMFLHWMDQYVLEFLIRIPHFTIPLVIFLLLKEKSDNSKISI